MRFSLRTLLFLLATLPPLIAIGANYLWPEPVAELTDLGGIDVKTAAEIASEP